jgi:hypothetical protein
MVIPSPLISRIKRTEPQVVGVVVHDDHGDALDASIGLHDG